MTEKCNCFDDNLALVKEHALKQIPEGAIDVDVRWASYSYFLSGDYSPVNPKVNVEYRQAKTKGGHRTNLTKDQVSMVASFCCYCGRKLKKSAKE